MADETLDYLRLYDKTYFAGGRAVSGYDDYAKCEGVLRDWSFMVERTFKPTSVLDVGAAYGFVVNYFRWHGVPAWGIEPSEFARSNAGPYVVPGALPDLPDTSMFYEYVGAEQGRFHTVTCTEVLEHIPEELVPASLQSLADKTGRFLVMLIMLEGPGADGDEGHICLKSRDWWQWQLSKTGLVQREDLEELLNNDPYSVSMYWSGRFFVRERAEGAESVAAGSFFEE